jgi:hypothetical protein
MSAKMQPSQEQGYKKRRRGAGMLMGTSNSASPPVSKVWLPHALPSTCPVLYSHVVAKPPVQ